jgi:hypothetical protein
MPRATISPLALGPFIEVRGGALTITIQAIMVG